MDACQIARLSSHRKWAKFHQTSSHSSPFPHLVVVFQSWRGEKWRLCKVFITSRTSSHFPKVSNVHAASHIAASFMLAFLLPLYFMLTTEHLKLLMQMSTALALFLLAMMLPFFAKAKGFVQICLLPDLFLICFAFDSFFFFFHILFLRSSQFSLSLAGCWHCWHPSALNLFGVKSYTQIFAFPVGTFSSLSKTSKFPCGNSCGRSQTVREGASFPHSSYTCISEHLW